MFLFCWMLAVIFDFLSTDVDTCFKDGNKRSYRKVTRKMKMNLTTSEHFLVLMQRGKTYLVALCSMLELQKP